MNALIYRPMKMPGFTFALNKDLEITCKLLSLCQSNCLMRPNMVCNGGKNTFWGFIRDSYLLLLFPADIAVSFGQSLLYALVPRLL